MLEPNKTSKWSPIQQAAESNLQASLTMIPTTRTLSPLSLSRYSDFGLMQVSFQLVEPEVQSRGFTVTENLQFHQCHNTPRLLCCLSINLARNILYSPKVDRDQSKGCCPMRILQWHTVQKPGPHGAQQILISPPKPSHQFPSSLAPQARSWSQTIEQTLQRTGNHCHCRWIGLWIPSAPWMTSGGPPISRSDRVPGPSTPHHPGRSSCWSRSRENTGDTTAPTSYGTRNAKHVETSSYENEPTIKL